MPVALQTIGQLAQLASVEVSSGTGASAAEQQPSPADFSPEARAALARLTGGSAVPESSPAPPAPAPTLKPTLTPPPAPKATLAPPPRTEHQDAEPLREIANNLRVAVHSTRDPNETRLVRGMFTAHGVAFDIPMLTPDNVNVGDVRTQVRLSLSNTVMPDGTNVASGAGRVTLVVRRGVVIGMLDGSLTYDASTTFVQRGNAPALVGHRGTPAYLLEGGAIVRDGRVVGLRANSTIDIDGIRIRSGAEDVDYRFTPPDLYGSSAGASVIATPSDRAIRVVGAGVSIVQGNLTTQLREGAIARLSGSVIETEGPVERFREMPVPPPTAEHAKALAAGELVLRRVAGAQLYIGGIASDDFDQIGAGDCYFMAPLNGLAEMEPETIERMITDNHDGTYTVRFHGDNGPVDITVDDRFYMAATLGDRTWYREKEGDLARYSNGMTSMQYAANPAEPREIWGAIVEKAYALWKGGYEKIYSGYPDVAMRELTGRLSSTVKHAESTPEAVFGALQRVLASRELTVATTDVPSTPETRQAVDAAFRQNFGMRNTHAYTVVSTTVEDGVGYVILRNTERLIEGRSSAYEADVDRDGDGRPDGQDGYFRLRADDYFNRFSLTTTLDRTRKFVPGTKQVPFASHPTGGR